LKVIEMPDVRAFIFILALLPGSLTIFAQDLKPVLPAPDKDESSLAESNSANLDARANAVAEVTEGVRLFKLKQFDDAARHYKKAIALNPDLYAPYHNLGVLYLDNRRYDDAIAAFEHAALINPGSVAAHKYLAFAYWRLQQPALAVEEYRREIALGPSALAQSNLGFALAELQHYDESEAAFDEALRLDGNLKEAVSGLCFVHTLRRSQQAVASCTRATQVDRDSASLHFLLGIADVDARAYHDAAKAFHQASLLAPDDLRIGLWLGKASFLEEDYRAALKTYSSVAASDPTAVGAYVGMGAAYFKLGQLSEAQESLNKAIALSPESSAAHYNLAVTCLQRRMRNCALEQYDVLKMISPELSSELFANLFSGRVVNARNLGRR
jgi:tetratricopeptide (TPR) repeat protein